MEKNYRLIVRSRVNSVLEGQDFQRCDRTTEKEAAQIGNVLNVPVVVMLDANGDGEKGKYHRKNG